MTNTGLTESDIEKIHQVFKKFSQIKKVVLYGSRAMGNYKPASDIDLTLIGDNIDLTTLNKIENRLDDISLPYKFDVSIYNTIENPDFIDHINRVGRIFYQSK